MNTLIPIEYYTTTYFNVLLLILIIIFYQSQRYTLSSSQNLQFKSLIGLFLLCFSILYMGLRPISGYYFGDMGRYGRLFQEYKFGGEVEVQKDYFFYAFMKLCSKFLTAGQFFVLCALIYIYPVYFISKRFFKIYWPYAFFILIGSFSFWTYGTNGIRNGLATALFLIGLGMGNKNKTTFFLILSTLFHQSMLLPVIAYYLAGVFQDKKIEWFIYGWFLCIIISLVSGTFWLDLFSSLSEISDARIGMYTGGFNQESEGVVLKVGFRWDFIFYSAIGVVAGWFYMVRKNFHDLFYKRLLQVYLMVNGFWILIIRVNYSNRFAYLSWFLLGLIVIYPLLRVKIISTQHRKIGVVTFFYFMFTYVLNVIFFS